MEIKKKIELVNDEIVKNGNTALAQKIATDGLEAIFSGMRTGTGQVTPEWRRLMSNFTDDDRELRRLCGEEVAFNNSKWGLFCLAYIAGDSTCGADTTMTGGALRSIRMHDELQKNTELQDNLDAELAVLENFRSPDTDVPKILK